MVCKIRLSSVKTHQGFHANSRNFPDAQSSRENWYGRIAVLPNWFLISQPLWDMAATRRGACMTFGMETITWAIPWRVSSSVCSCRSIAGGYGEIIPSNFQQLQKKSLKEARLKSACILGHLSPSRSLRRLPAANALSGVGKKQSISDHPVFGGVSPPDRTHSRT